MITSQMRGTTGWALTSALPCWVSMPCLALVWTPFHEFRVVMPFSNPSLPGRRALIAVSDGTPVSYHPPPWPSQPLVWDPISTKSGQKVQQARAWSPALRRSMQTTRCSSIPTQEHAHVHERARTHTDTHAHTLHRSTIWDF